MVYDQLFFAALSKNLIRTRKWRTGEKIKMRKNKKCICRLDVTINNAACWGPYEIVFWV